MRRTGQRADPRAGCWTQFRRLAMTVAVAATRFTVGCGAAAGTDGSASSRASRPATAEPAAGHLPGPGADLSTPLPGVRPRTDTANRYAHARPKSHHPAVPRRPSPVE